MKILFLNGSPRKNGYTVNIMKCIERKINSKHCIEWIHAYDLRIRPCLSCLKCRPNKECLLPKDDAHMVWHKIHSADVLIIGSPTYFGNISGQLKLLIDRNLTAFESMPASGLEPPTPLQKGKKAVMVTTCNTPYPISELQNQAKGTLQAIEAIFKAGGYTIIGSIIGDGSPSKNEIPLNIEEKAEFLAQLL